MKEQPSAGSQPLELESSQSISSVWRTLKNSIFDVLFVLLDNSDQEESMLGLCFETGVDYLQMMAFPFSPQVLEVWNADDTLSSITNIFSSFNISNYIPGVGFDTFLIMLYSLILLIILVLCDIIYVAYSFSQKRFRFTWPLIFLARAVPIIVTVLFLPIMETLLQVVNCETLPGEDYQVLATFQDVRCWQGWHLFHTTVTLLFSFIFVFVSCVVTLALFQPRMTTNRLTARQNSTGEVVFIINKIACQFIFSFSPFDGSFPYSIMLFTLSAWLYSTYNLNLPYYDKKASKFFRIVSTYYFWTNLMLIVGEILKPLGFQQGLVIWSCGILFIGITIVFQRKSNIDTLFSSSLKFKSGEELGTHLQYVLQLHHNRNEDKNSYMLLLGYIEKHIELCLEEDCPLKTGKKKFKNGKEEEEYYCNQLLEQLERMFIYGIKKYPECTKLRLTFAFFYLEQYNNSAKAYEYFTKALTIGPSFGEQFIIYRFRKIIGEKLEQNKDNSENDLIELIKFENHVSLCEEGMGISGRLHKEFWTELKEESPNLERLNMIGAQIINTSSMVKQNYKEIIKISSDGLAVMELQYNFALYLICIEHEAAQGKDILQKVTKKFDTRKRIQLKQEAEKQPDPYNQILQGNKSVVVCQMEFGENGGDPCCMIKKVNRKFLSFTKYREQELVQKRLDKVLPKVLQDFHDFKIKQWLFTSNYLQAEVQEPAEMPKNEESSQELIKQRYVGVHLNGYIKESSSYIRKVNYRVHFILAEMLFVTQVDFLAVKNTCSLICDTEGIILESSLSTSYRFRNLDSCLEIDSLLNVSGLADKVRLAPDNKYEHAISVPCNHLSNKAKPGEQKRYVCVFEKMEFNYIDGSWTKKGRDAYSYENLIARMYKANEKKQYVGITIDITEIITESKPSIVKAQKSVVSKTTKNMLPSQTNNISKNILSDIRTEINIFYEKESQFHRTSPLVKSLKHSSSRSGPTEQAPRSKDYSTYLGADQQICTIKAYRYHNQQFTRIYYDDLLDEQSSYDFEQKLSDLEAKLASEKLAKPQYQERIRRSLNTFIYHPEVIALGLAAWLVYSAWLALSLASYRQFMGAGVEQRLADLARLQTNTQNVKVITMSMSEWLAQKQFTQQSRALLKEYKVDFEALDGFQNVVPVLQFGNSTFLNTSLSDALTLIQAKLLEDASTTLSQSMQTAYHSYLTIISPVLLLNFPSHSDPPNTPAQQNSVLWASLVVTCLLGLLFIFVWVYQELKIRHKIYEVLIWFLDIPFDYIEYAERQCVLFSKNYFQGEAIKEKSDFETPIGEQSAQETRYKLSRTEKRVQKQQEAQGDQNQYFKARQMLISRYRHRSLLKMLQPKQVYKILTLPLLLAFAVAFLVVSHNTFNEFVASKASLDEYIKGYIQIQNLQMFLSIENQKRANGSLWASFTFTQVIENESQILAHLRQESRQIIFPLLSTFNPQLVPAYSQVEYSDLCSLSQDQTQCRQLIEGRLTGGYTTVMQYIKDLSKQPTGAQISELETAYNKYTVPHIFALLGELTQALMSKLQSLYSAIDFSFYSYLVVVSLAFVFAWHLYLRGMNLTVNQTIRIVNVIPMELIPVARRETREFLRWLGVKASQHPHEEEKKEY